MAVISPDSFQSVILAWLAALSLVLVGVAAFIPKLMAVAQQVKDSWERLNTHRDQIASQQAQITEVALSTPANGASSAPAKVEVTNSNSNPVPVQEKQNP